MKTTFQLLVTVLAFFGTASTALHGAETKKIFPVMAWNHVPNNPEVIKKMRECGLTVAGFANVETLKQCRAAGLKAIVNDPRAGGYDWNNVDEKIARNNVASLVKQVGKDPSVYGFYLRDEPRAAMFPGLAKVASLIHEMAPGKWAYINLFPNYADAPSQLNTANYEEYLEKFVATCHPTELSYDHYAMIEGGSLREGYWQNLEQMRAAAKKHGLPFWNIVLTAAHYTYREPTAADIRFQVYSTLAYGARGIAYFTYFAPELENYRAAPVDQFGNLTPTWYYLQNANLQIEKLAPTLLELTSDDVYHFGSVPAGCHGPSDKSLVVSATDHVAIGDFTHTDGSRYVMLVNKSFSNSIACVPQFRNAPKQKKWVSPYSGKLESLDAGHVWLAPGQGALLKLE